MAGAFKHTRVFSFIGLMVLLTFVQPSITLSSPPELELAQEPEKVGVSHAVAFPSSELLKSRTEPRVKVPADRSIEPVLQEETKWVHRVTVPDLFSYNVIQQPQDKPYFVSSERDLVTEFSLPKKYGNIGLVAHNDLAGNLFSRLNVGQQIHVTYQDGHTDQYTVNAIYRYRALEPTKTESQFVDLASEKVYSASEVFVQMYTGESHLTLQTCIYADGDKSWGRLFVIAIPVTKPE